MSRSGRSSRPLRGAGWTGFDARELRWPSRASGFGGARNGRAGAAWCARSPSTARASDSCWILPASYQPSIAALSPPNPTLTYKPELAAHPIHNLPPPRLPPPPCRRIPQPLSSRPTLALRCVHEIVISRSLYTYLSAARPPAASALAVAASQAR